MMSLQAIQEINEKIAAEAAAERREPFMVIEQDLDRWRATVDAGDVPTMPFPNLGYHEPEGWDLLDTLFVDKLGWNLHDAGGPALPVYDFIYRLEAGFGYAIVEEGPFQVYVGKFKRV